MITENKTIAAISTAAGSGGIGIVRISGEEAFTYARSFFRAYNKAFSFDDLKSHTVHYGYIVDGDNVIDEALVLFMKGPHTYTCEDVVEIDCHGGPLVVKKILDTVIKAGCALAQPGEFTKRAFLNGRIDLSQAEAVIDVINAENEYALSASVSQLRGNISEEIKDMRAVIINQLAFIESAIDDPEHYSVDGYGSELLGYVEDIINRTEKLIASSENGRIIKEGIKTVILGKPNVGKSSLMNTLLGEERAIVTHIPGTTRDSLEENVRIGDISLNIIDTAGIRQTDDIVEKIGVEKARNYAEEADLIVFVVDSSRPLSEEDYEIIEFIKEKKFITLLNKNDLEMKVNEEELKGLLSQDLIKISAKENAGIDELEGRIKEMFYEGKISFNDQIYITNARHKEALMRAKQSLSMVKRSIEDDMPEDFFSIDLMAAYEAYGTIIGEAVEDDLADEIFSKFCMGK